MNVSAGTQQNPSLNCFGGGPAPPPVSDGFRRLIAMPEPVREGFWGLLEPVLREPGDLGHQDRLSGFCHQFELPEAPVLEAIQACDTLLHQAAAFDLDRDGFGQDLTALSGLFPQGLDPLLDQYDTMRSELRARLVQETLADHGKVLLGLDWRVDNIVSSDRGIGLEGTVVLLTLRYREGDRVDRVTLQLTPDSLAELKRFTGRIQG